MFPIAHGESKLRDTGDPEEKQIAISLLKSGPVHGL